MTFIIYFGTARRQTFSEMKKPPL